jgi:DNA-binding SARP family transcriptional activator/tetratricopeptide (TPR) repeat protein
VRGRARGDPAGGGRTRPPRLHVRVLGGLDLELDGRPLEPIPSSRARSLLGRLVVHDRVAHTREGLAFALWPDSSEGQARTNLRNVLHTLRRSCPPIVPHLEVTDQTLRWRTGPEVWVDLRVHEAALDEAASAAPGSDERIAALHRAADAYGGDLLAGSYDDWTLEDRARLRDRHLRSLRELAGELVERAAPARAVDVARRLVREDPLDEESHRLLITCHASAGDRAGAVRAYHECVSTLRRELGVEPSASTRAAYDEVVRAPSPPEVTTPPPAPGHARGRLVGRDRELRRLERCWEEARAGRAHLALVTGEPGIGKTRLAEALTDLAAQQGAVVATARAYRAEGELGHGLVTEWLRSPSLAPALARLPERSRLVLARLVPDGASLPDRPGASDPGSDPDDRRQLFEAVGQLVAATGQPTLLVADDLQWADRSSLQVLHHLVRVEPPRRLLVVATARLEDLEAAHPARGLTADLTALDRLVEVPLDRLSVAATSDLAAVLLGHDLDEAAVAELVSHTEGSPLFVVEAINGGWNGAADQPTALSPRLQAVISRRLQDLSPRAREVLGLAAAAGRDFPATLVGRASGLDDLTLARALDELWRRGLVREHGQDTYDFTHGRIRDIAYDELGPAARRAAHLQVAEALQAHRSADPDEVSGQVATAYELAGRFETAIAWYLRAARRAQIRYADPEALALLERALELAVALPEERRASHELDVLARMPTVLVGVDGFGSERVTAVQQRAISVADGLGVDPEPPVLRSLVLSRLCLDDFAGARASAADLRRSAAERGDDGLAVEAAYLEGIAAFWSGDLPAARHRFEAVADGFSSGSRAEHLLRFGHDPAAVCRSRLANVLWFLGDEAGARAARAQAVEAAREVGHPYTRHVVHTFAVVLALDLGEHDEVRRFGTILDEGASHARPFELNAQAFAGLADVAEGRVEAGLAQIRASIEECGSRNHAPGFRAALARVLLAATDIAPDPGSAVRAADEALAIGGTRLWEPEARRVRARWLVAAGGDPAEAAAELERARATAKELGLVGPTRRIDAHTTPAP